MAGVGQLSPIQHVYNKQPVKGLQELFGLTLPLFFLTLALLSLALSLAQNASLNSAKRYLDSVTGSGFSRSRNYVWHFMTREARDNGAIFTPTGMPAFASASIAERRLTPF